MKTVQKIVISVCVMLTLQAQAEVGPHNATSLMGPEIQTAQHGRQVSFVSPDAAINSLVDAIRQGNQIKMRRVLGETAIPAVYLSDRVLNNMSNEHFLRAFDEKHSIEFIGMDKGILLIGNEEWSLPFPLRRVGSRWVFDEVAGVREWQNRRIGSDEIAAIQVSLAYADAQREYVLQDRNSDGLLEYAQKIASTPGLHNGLYWKTTDDEPLSPMGQAFADAHEDGARRMPGASGHAFHGYYFRILTAQGTSAPGGSHSYLVKERMIGGFALIAYPESYGMSGVKSFIISHQGIVYSKDLGVKTKLLASKMMLYDPDVTWTKESD
ncbi:DUF2950 domain-containing protein [Undibacterium sp. RuRC25W]|uniref:DUF2950 domain-containing protein n=1 Tax=Undibacterium sp. RuRC25W TaxID=3413047 RepID=UPI003BEF6910